MKKTLYNLIAKDGKRTIFGLPYTEELTGRSALLPDGTSVRFDDEPALKCDDDLFLAAVDGMILLVEELPDETLKALDAEQETAAASALPSDLEGWETELSFASGDVLTAVFKNGTLTLSPAPEPVIAGPFGGPPAAPAAAEAAEPPVTLPVRAVKTGDRRFLFRLPESGETVFLNGRRFLLYALLGGRAVCGFVEPPAAEG